MVRTLLRRILISVPVLFAVSILTFALTALTPGDPALTILGYQATPQAVAALDASLGLNKPVDVQYWHWLTGAFHGDLGTSLFTGQSVTSLLSASTPITLTLIIGAVLLALVVGVPLGVASARRARSRGQLIDALSLTGFAIPAFFLGLLLTQVFANELNILPASGWVPFAQSISGWFRSLVLPVLTLGIPGAAVVARQTRQGMIEVLSKEFVRSLRGRGLSEASIVYKHALRNSLGNVITLLGLYVVGLLLGTTLVETVFAVQGLGSLAVQATQQHNLPVLEGVAVIFTIIVVVVFALVDVSRAWLNPKLRTR
jgi:peptide/nickel transport system permease protein